VVLSLFPLVEAVRGFDLEPFWRGILEVAASADEQEGLQDIDVAAKVHPIVAAAAIACACRNIWACSHCICMHEHVGIWAWRTGWARAC
jgi:hypothetical protein